MNKKKISAQECLLQSPLKIVFMGTPEYSCASLASLHQQKNIEIVGVYTQPPREKGRGHAKQLSPVHVLANTLGVPVFCPINFKNQWDIDQLRNLKPDLVVVVAYGLLLPKNVLNIPPMGCLNAHGSVLPRWRGAAPIQRCLIAKDCLTGISIMNMDEGLDTGEVISYWPHPIDDTSTFSSLVLDLSILSAHALCDTVERLIQGEKISSHPQSNHGITYAKKITKEDGLLDFSQNAWDLDARIRALNPYPGTWFIDEQECIKIRESKPLPATLLTIQPQVGQWIYDPSYGVVVGCGYGVLQAKILQRSNKKPLSALDFINGYSLIKK